MYPMKLIPETKDYLWGGQRLEKEFGIRGRTDILAEAWTLSCHPDGESVVANGHFQGMTLRQVLFGNAEKALGDKTPLAMYFPILIKLIDARQSLSVQVHPSDMYAFSHECGKKGKTEMWYVLDCKKDAFLYGGFSELLSVEQMREKIENNTFAEALCKVPVQKGDTFYIEAGTVHAIGEGILLAEIQQNSNSTYRVYDFNRVGPDGKKRELHIEKAMDVICPSQEIDRIEVKDVSYSGYKRAKLVSCPYFSTERITVDSVASLTCDEHSFMSFLFIEGEGRLVFPDNPDQEDLQAVKGDCFFLPAGTGLCEVQGCCVFLMSK